MVSELVLKLNLHIAPSSPTLLAIAVLSAAAPAAARSNGLQGSCEGCHGSATQAQISITADPPAFAPGDNVTFSIVIKSASIQAGGVFVPKPATGVLGSIAGEGLALSEGGLVHSTPKAAAGGQSSFRFSWRAPTTPGGVFLEAYGLASNRDGRSGGDTPGYGVFSAAYGCTPQTFYFDSDADGYGSELLQAARLGCMNQPPPQHSARNDDCDENNGDVHPGAPELCNEKDDNCNKEIDENSDPVELWPDEDGDGFYVAKTGTSVVGCLPYPGYAAKPGDCAARDKNRYPGAPELCNLFDDNCDGRVDERVRPQCGEGFCRNESFTCNVADCVPSPAQSERCNLLDDDCDGEVDEGSLCAEGLACLGGRCAPSDGSTPAADGGGGGVGSAPPNEGGTRPGMAGAAGSRPNSGAGGSPGAPVAGIAGTGDEAPEAPRESGCSAALGPAARPGIAAVLAVLAACAVRLRRRGARRVARENP